MNTAVKCEGMPHQFEAPPAQRRFPIQQGGTVDWAAAEQAYARYVAQFGHEQSLQRLAERGGFGIGEFCLLYSGIAFGRSEWRSTERTAFFVLQTARELGERWQP